MKRGIDVNISKTFEKIANPLNMESLNKLIKIYATSFSEEQLLDQFWQINSLNIKDELITVPSDFAIFMFNLWHQSVLEMTNTEYEKKYQEGILQPDFIQMRECLKGIAKVNTNEQLIEAITQIDKMCPYTLAKYGWDSYQKEINWQHISKHKIHLGSDKYPFARHTFYINVLKSEDLFLLSKELINKYEQAKINYYFKINLRNQDNSLVIYVNDECLPKNIKIFKAIKKENPDLIKRIGQPPILTGKINNWLGYMAITNKLGKTPILEFIVNNLIVPTFDKYTRTWIYNNRYLQIKSADKSYTLEDFITLKATDVLIDILRQQIKKIENKGNGIKVIDELGYTREDLNSTFFRENIFNIIKQNMDTMLALASQGNMAIEPVLMKVRNEKIICFKKEYLENILKPFALKIVSYDSNYLVNINNSILDKVEEFDISKNNICFNCDTLERLKVISAKDSRLELAGNNLERESYRNLMERISGLGELKDVIKDQELLKSIIAYNGDRRLFRALIEVINDGLSKGIITDDDLELFTNGFVVNALINLDETLSKFSNRVPYPDEMTDKLNYLSLIKSAKAYASSFTEPIFIQAFSNHQDKYLAWVKNKNIPLRGFATVVNKLINQKQIEAAKEYINSMACVPNLNYEEDNSQKANIFILTNNGNTSYQEMLDQLNSYGTIKDILRSSDFVKAIIAYNGDGKFFQVFIDLINKGLQKSEIMPWDLQVFTTGKVADAIVNIEETCLVYGKRKSYAQEMPEKLSYLAYIKDAEAFAASFTHPKVIQELINNYNIYLDSWANNIEIPVGGYAAFIKELLNNNAIEIVQRYLKKLTI